MANAAAHITKEMDNATGPKSNIQKGQSTTTVLSLFSGAGGLDLGFAAAGYNVCCSVDCDPYSCRTLETNNGKRNYVRHTAILERDIRAFSSDEVFRSSGLNSGDIDFIIGGPPCQAFSVFGRRGGLSDPRGNLVWEYLRIVKELQPNGFVFENVGGLKSIHNGQLYADLLEALSCDGKYTVSDHSYDVADYGIPQFRYRVIFVGLRNGMKLEPMPPTHGENDSLFLRPRITAGKALSNMPEAGTGLLPNHVGRIHSQRIIDRYNNLRFGERDPKTRINKLNPEKPSFTIIVGSDAGGGKGHVHPFYPREVTPRESARIQTFPDWWEFAGTGRHVIRQVGNAVPPLFAGQLASYIANKVYGRTQISYEELIDRLELDYLKD